MKRDLKKKNVKNHVYTHVPRSKWGALKRRLRSHKFSCATADIKKWSDSTFISNNNHQVRNGAIPIS